MSSNPPIANTAPGADDGPGSDVEQNDARPKQVGSVVQLTPQEEAALLALYRRYLDENRQARLEEVKRCQLGYEFYRGNQNVAWNGQARQWQKVGSQGLSTKSPDDLNKQRYSYVTNIYAANVDTTVAFLATQIPKIHFAPQSVRQDDDVVTAKAASKVATFIEDNNRIEERRIEQCFHLSVGGVACAYVRFVIDGERFGYDSIPDFAQEFGEIAPQSIQCPTCGASTPAPQEAIAAGQFPTQCDQPGCGTPLSADNIRPPQMGMKTVQVGSHREARGQEQISIFGPMEVQRPYFARHMADFPWLALETEVPKAKLKTVYKDKAKEIDSASESTEEGGASMVSRHARIALAATSQGRSVGGNQSQGLPTLNRVWLRNWSFYDSEDDKMADALAAKFPSGCYMAVLGDLILEARDENMDGQWSFVHAKPGSGQIREGIHHSMIDIQRRYNIEENIMTETFEHMIPTRFMDPAVVNIQAYKDAGASPGLHMAAEARPGSKLADSIYDTPGAQVSPQLVNHMQWLFGETSQMVTGNFPALFGGSTGSNDTATGITIARDQAAGRMGMFMVAMRDFWARTMLNAVDCFRNNRQEDVELAVLGADQEWQADQLHLDDLRGNIYARAEADEAIPKTWSERRKAINDVLANPNQQLASILFSPENINILEEGLGIEEIILPGEDARMRQMKQIKEMLVNPAPIPVDPILDDNQTMFKTIVDWANSADGQVAMTTNPQGFMAVRMQAEQRSMIMQQQAMAQAQAQQPQQAPPQ